MDGINFQPTFCLVSLVNGLTIKNIKASRTCKANYPVQSVSIEEVLHDFLTLIYLDQRHEHLKFSNKLFTAVPMATA